VSALPLLAQVAAHGLPLLAGTLTTPERATSVSRPPDAATWMRLLRDVRRLRLSGLLQSAIADEVLAVTDEQRQAANELHLTACVSALTLERALLRLTDTLERAGIDVVVLKGTAAAHLLYPDPTVRMFGDNDLLFRAGQIDRALQVLADVGYDRPRAAPRPDYDRRFGKGATLIGPDGDELDVHRTLLFGSFGLRVDTDELFASTVTFRLGGQELRALGPDTGLLHACYHAALGDPMPRLGSVRDVAQRFALAQHDPARLQQLVDQWRAAPVVARAVQLCVDHLGVHIDDPVADAARRHVTMPHERRAIASYVGSNRSHAAKVVASLPYLDGVPAKTAFLRANLAPSTSFVRSRGGRPGLAWIRRGVRSLRSGTPRPTGSRR
jgi:hypothetical protein